MFSSPCQISPQPTPLNELLTSLHGNVNITETFNAIWALGAQNVAVLVYSLLCVDEWDKEPKRLKVVIDVATLLLAKLLEPGLDDIEMTEALQALARLMAAEAKQLANLMTADNMEIVFLNMNISKAESVRMKATLIIAKVLEQLPEKASFFTDFVTSRIYSPTIDTLVSAVSATAAVFPILPGVAANLFLTEGLLPNLVDVLRRSHTDRLRRAALELFSAACIERKSRKAIHVECSLYLHDIFQEQRGNNDEDAALAALVIAKTEGAFVEDTHPSSGSDTSFEVDANDSLVAFFRGLVLDGARIPAQIAVEGLAFSSRQPSIKELIVNDTAALKHLINIMIEPDCYGPVVFGGLTVFSNLSSFQSPQSPEQKRMAELKAYAGQSKLKIPDPLDDDQHVTARCGKLINAGVVAVLHKYSKHASLSIYELISNITLSLTKDRKRRGTLVQQGLFDVMLRYANTDNMDGVYLKIRRNAAHALALTMISNENSLLFRNRPVESAIRPLAFLLKESTSDEGGGLFPKFAALRALTNLACLDERTCVLITDQVFPLISMHLWSTASNLAQAAIECISNLTNNPSAVSLIISPPPNTSSDARNLLPLLFALSQSEYRGESRGTRHAATATLTKILMYEEGAQVVLRMEQGVQRLVDIVRSAVEEGDQELLLRGVTAVEYLLGNGGEEARRKVGEVGGVDVFDQLARDGGEGADASVGEIVDAVIAALR